MDHRELSLFPKFRTLDNAEHTVTRLLRMVSRGPSSVVASATSCQVRAAASLRRDPPWNNTAARVASTRPRRRNVDDCAMKKIVWAPPLSGV